MALEIGSVAPAFSGVNQNGETITSEQFRGKKIILFFYPKASTPGCTVEACDFRAWYPNSSRGWKAYRKMSDINDPGPTRTWVFVDEREDSINNGFFVVDMTGYPDQPGQQKQHPLEYLLKYL